MAYTDIKVKAITQTAQAVKLQLIDSGPVTEWVPRVHLEDEGDSVDDALATDPNKVFVVSVKTWKCDYEGWQ